MRFRFDMYVSGDTAIHRCDPRTKIVLLAVFSLAVLIVRTWWGIGLLACVEAIVLALSTVPVRLVNRSLVPVYVLAGFTLLFHVIAQPNAVGLQAGAFLALRMVVLVAGSFAVCFTTTATELVDALRSLLRPLRLLRVPVDDVAFTLSLALRFVPVIGEEAVRVHAAHRARGSALPASIGLRLRRFGSMFASVFVGLFRRADTLSQAMDARCYGAVRRRTALVTRRFSGESAAVLIVGCVALVCVCVFL